MRISRIAPVAVLLEQRRSPDRAKKRTWTYTDNKPSGIHHFQILDTDGKPLERRPLR